jgi:PAS domain S-box-containing protein
MELKVVNEVNAYAFREDNATRINNNNYEVNFQNFNYLPYAVLVQKDGIIVYGNDELAKLLRYKDNLIIGKPVSEVFLPDICQGIKASFEDNTHIRNGHYKINDFESKVIHIDIKGSTRQIGGYIYEFIVIRDITLEVEKQTTNKLGDCSSVNLDIKDSAVEELDRNQLWLEFTKSRELYKKLIDILPEGICIHDGKNYSFVSDNYVKILGYSSSDELMGKEIKEVVSKESHHLLEERMKTLLSQDAVLPSIEYEFITKQGNAIHVETTSIKFWHNNKLNILSTIRDVTEKKRAEERRLLMEKTIEYDKLRTEFFANMSHELRTPLNILLSSLQLINLYISRDERTSLSTIKKYSAIMKQNCYRLLRLVNNLLDITKIDAGFYKLNLANHDIVKVVEEITESVAEYIKEKSIEIIFDTDVEEKILCFDEDIIERIILNLLSNSVKFTKAGGKIEVNIHELSDSINIRVKDTGSGIPKNKLDIIFDRFMQVDKTLSRESEGTGIGLALVKSLVEMHEGSITVKSKLGEFTQFDIILPDRILCNEKHGERKKAAAETDLNHKKVERMNIEFSDIYL